eukprot:372934-Karenia_brevis.AAC.1
MVSKLAHDIACQSARVALTTISNAVGVWSGTALLQRMSSWWGNHDTVVKSVPYLSAVKHIPDALQV